MAQPTDPDDKPEADEASEVEAPGAEASAGAIAPVVGGGAETDEEPAARALGTQRYVHAAFFAAGVFIAFVSGKVLASVWGQLAEWPTAVRAIPALVSYPEEQRDTITLAAGVAIGAVTVVQAYRREAVRRWADQVAEELEKVTWPNRETVMNGTIVVVIAGAIATIYVAVLDRFWGFLTTLVYGT